MRFVVEFNGKFYCIIDQVSATEVDSFTTQEQADHRAEQLNAEKGW